MRKNWILDNWILDFKTVLHAGNIIKTVVESEDCSYNRVSTIRVYVKPIGVRKKRCL